MLVRAHQVALVNTMSLLVFSLGIFLPGEHDGDICPAILEKYRGKAVKYLSVLQIIIAISRHSYHTQSVIHLVLSAETRRACGSALAEVDMQAEYRDAVMQI